MPVASYGYRGYYNLYLDIDETGILAYSMRTISCSLSFLTLYFYPSFVAGFCSFLYHQTSDSLVDFYAEIRHLQRMSPNRMEMVRAFQKQKVLYRLARCVGTELSNIVFLVLCSQVLCMFMALATLVALSPRLMSVSLMSECMLQMILPALTVVVTVISASKFPQ